MPSWPTRRRRRPRWTTSPRSCRPCARRGPPGGAVGSTARARLVASLAADSASPATGAPPGEAWYHVTLAPKGELRYQLTGDRRRDAAVLHMIRRAVSFLATIAAKGPE